MKTFAEMSLISAVQKALTEEKYETPTPIQAQTVPPALTGRDVLGCAQTGTGKTAAFALPILHQLGQTNRRALPSRPFVLVLAPTRELAIQIGQSFATYGRHLKLRQALVYGGVGQAQQVRALKRGAHLLIATPGRLLDLMNQGHIHLDQLETFVLDEADRMLDMGFLPDLKRIIACLPPARQSLFFSATLPPKIVELSQQLLSNPVSVNVTPASTSVERIDQRVLYVERGAKQGLLQDILRASEVNRALVFTRTKRGANMVAEKLVKCGISATAIHGNKTQAARQRALEAFRRKHVQVLVATDVAARGIDIDGITHVINFDLPIEPEAYVHRIGRTGRAGAEGTALSFCTADERRELHAIEKLIGQKVPADPRGSSEPARRSHAPQGGGERRKQTSGPRAAGGRGKYPAGRQRSAQPSKDSQSQSSGHSQRARQEGVRPAQPVAETPIDANTRPRRPRRKGRNRRQRAAQTS